MKVSEPELPKIVKVFPPANSPNYDRLYVEFDTEHSADYASSFKRNIRKSDIHVGSYFPRMFQARFRALNSHARLIREAPGLNKGDVKTKVVYGTTDMHILSRTRDGRWRQVNLDIESLPPVQLNATDSSSSPPIGRNRVVFQNNQKRAGSPLENDSKVQKGSHDSDEQNKESVDDNANNGSFSNLNDNSQPKTPRRRSASLSSDLVKNLYRGSFGETAAVSPRIKTNKDFTFHSRLPMKAVPSLVDPAQSLN